MADSHGGPEQGKALTSDAALEIEFSALFADRGYSKKDDTPCAGFADVHWEGKRDPDRDDAITGPLALCLSGGGIRSATFSLGVLQGLSRQGLLEPFDYLSTVSGGGYIGSWLSRWLAGEASDDKSSGDVSNDVSDRAPRKMAEALTEKPFVPDSDTGPVRRLRSFSNFMSPTLGVSGDIFTVASIFVRNLFLNWLFWIPFLLVLAALPWLLILLLRQIRPERLQQIDAVNWGAGAVPALMLVVWIAISMITLAFAPFMGEAKRELLSRWSARLAMVGAAWLGLFAAFIYAPAALIDMLHRPGLSEITGITFGGGAFAVISGLAGFWSRYGEDLRKKAYGIADVLGTTILNVMALLATLAMASTAAIVMSALLDSISGRRSGLKDGFLTTSDVATRPDALLTLAILLMFAVTTPFFLGCNRFSLHALYGNRLTRAFLGTARIARTPPYSATDFDDADDVPLSALGPASARHPEAAPRIGQGKGPFHIINMTLNMTRTRRSSLAWQERKAASFTASALHFGSDITGFANSRNMSRKKEMTLARAMTISGAAVSPNMGYHSSPLMALVMSIFNLRLGWWVPHPRHCMDANNLPPDEPAYGVFYTLSEAFRGTDDRNDWLYLSDGGHFDNLGLYEMVRRHCRLIVVVDGGCDGRFKFADLHNALRKISVDLAIPIYLPSVLPGQPGSDGSRIAIGKIGYSERDGRFADGTLIVLKPMLNGTEPPALLEFAQTSRRRDHSFPHHSTADQFFSETQFESYRQLGEITAGELTGRGLLREPEPKTDAPGASKAFRGDIPAAALSDGDQGASQKEPAAREIPQAVLAGPPGIADTLATLSMGQIFTGLAASAGILTAVTTVTHRFSVDTYEAARTGLGVQPKSDFVLGMSAADRDLIRAGLKIEVSDTLRSVTELVDQLNGLAARTPPQFRARVEHDLGTAQLSAAIANLSGRIARLQLSPAAPGLTRADLQPIQVELTRIRNIIRDLPQSSPTDLAPVTRQLTDLSRRVETVSKKIDAANPRVGARGQ